ncbi:MAG: hypothetical protein KatS3mg032_0009 [Cyclobacteriaceae bacterium]|nr:MAG: hypothetical protein KatS3mg032_0009 [Cyclobacteriaceae bacterium]
MKILQLIQKPQLRGAEVFACQLSNQLLQAGHEVLMFSLFPGDSPLPFAGKHIPLHRPPGNRFFDYRGWKLLAQCIYDFKPDVVQANAGDTLKYAVLSKLLFRWKAPVVFRNGSVMSRYIQSPVVKAWNAFLMRNVTYVVSVSDESSMDLVKLFPFMQNRIRTIPIGIDLPALPSTTTKTKSYIVHIGGFTFEKNHTRLLHIFKRLHERHPELSLWLVGDGPLRKMIEQQTAEMGLSSVVKFLGIQNDVMPLLQSAKILVLPSVIEGLPGVILEAMYCKIPVVAYAVGGVPEVVKNRVTGWLVQAGDEAGFVNAVNEVLQLDAGKLTEITDRAHQQVVSGFNNKAITKKFVEVYLELAGVTNNTVSGMYAQQQAR